MPENVTTIESPEKPSGPLEGRLMTMPEHYIPKEKKGISPRLILVVGGSLILVVVVIVVLLLFLPSDRQPAVQQPVISPVVDEMPATAPTEDDITAPEQDIEPVEPEDEEVVDTITEAEILLPSVGLGQYSKSEDTDQDGLTDLEEQIFTTSPAVPDTDDDSFLDGAEIGNLYDPATSGALLEVSPQVQIVKNTELGYQLLIPANWTSTLPSPSGEEFIIDPADGSESFIITVYPNENRLSAVQWYQQEVPAADLNLFRSFSNEAGWTGIRSKDSFLVVATYGSSEPGARALIFVMFYDIGNEDEIRYPSIWNMMINSLTELGRD